MKLKIKQTKKIRGEITVSGSKNATLPILAVSILTNEKIKLINVPDIVFPYETIVSLVDTAGKYIGIGSQRKNGMGRYHIENVEVIKS